jgi:hypothetical protein
MNPIVHKISWFMEMGKLRNIDKFQGEQIVPVTSSDLNCVLHPSSAWTVIAEFDDRAYDLNDREYYEQEYLHTRSHTFTRNATLLDLLQWIASGRCYGYFEGLQKFPGYDSVYTLMWGT